MIKARWGDAVRSTVGDPFNPVGGEGRDTPRDITLSCGGAGGRCDPPGNRGCGGGRGERYSDGDDAAANGFGGGLGPVINRELIEDVGDVAFHGVFGDRQSGCNFLIGMARGD